MLSYEIVSTGWGHHPISVNERIGQLQGLSENLKQATAVFKSNINPLLIIDIAKLDHVQFVNRIERCVDGKEAVTSSALPDHHNCRFGKWYFGDGQQLCGNLHSFKAIDVPHEKIHRIAKEIVELKNGGDVEQAEKKLLELENISGEIVQMLENVKRESREGGNQS